METNKLKYYSANNNNVQVEVTGWRYPVDDANYTVKYNQDIVCAIIHIASGVNFATSDKEFGADVLRDTTHNIDLRPSRICAQFFSNSRWVWITENSYRFYYKALANASNVGAWAMFTYPRK